VRFERRFLVDASRDKVLEFHLRPAGLAILTPPPAIVRIHKSPNVLREGDVLVFTLWLGPVPVYWESVFPEVSNSGFVDTQGKGPFRAWEHRHTFVEISDNATEVIDVVEASLPLHPWKAIVAMVMWASLPLLFAYRAWQTRRQLET
jgi:ligand-binding SRPBCC domain-containing protein